MSGMFVPTGPLPSTTNYSFAQVPQANIERSTFDRSHGIKTTFDAGYLVPCFVDEVLPGDTHQVSASFFARLATPLTPFMDNLWFETFFFFVPCRLVWEHWEQMNGQQANPGDSTDYIVPTVTVPAGGYANGSIFDFLGLPTQVSNLTPPNAMPLRAINLTYNEWFRDQNLQDSLPVPTGDGPDPYTDYVLFKRNKRHDYFTSCLPWAQKGDPVEIPLTGNAPVLRESNATFWKVYDSGSNTLNISTTLHADGSGRLGDAVAYNLSLDPNGGLYADLSDVTAATINSLRQAFQIQKVLERDARGGTRYTEILRAHFGVISPDARLQRPEYLGGGKTPVQLNPIAQTSATADDTTPQANLAAVGSIRAMGHSFAKSFVEHGYIVGFMCVYADLTYQQGMNKLWTRQTRFDFYLPAFAHLGEQAVLNQEIYAQGTSADTEVFGYQERWAEYRYKPSLITGQFRSNFAQSLDVWHLAQDFTALPVLDSSFISENPPVDRVIAVESESGYPQFLLDGYFKMKSTRPMPLFSVPGYIDHF